MPRVNEHVQALQRRPLFHKLQRGGAEDLRAVGVAVARHVQDVQAHLPVAEPGDVLRLPGHRGHPGDGAKLRDLVQQRGLAHVRAPHEAHLRDLAARLWPLVGAAEGALRVAMAARGREGVCHLLHRRERRGPPASLVLALPLHGRIDKGPPNPAPAVAVPVDLLNDVPVRLDGPHALPEGGLHGRLVGLVLAVLSDLPRLPLQAVGLVQVRRLREPRRHLHGDEAVALRPASAPPGAHCRNCRQGHRHHSRRGARFARGCA
mmetsp:Transcript_34652/g.93867  ORF Transcript_34652/g.93867 Transcript_34652/m.93867 type:complete len:262 (-) Transcript_34652:50-835(-)